MVHVNISNVARWFYSDNSQENYSWADDFPCLLCPWEEAVFVYDMPAIVNSNGHIRHNSLLERVTVEVKVLDLAGRPRDARDVGELVRRKYGDIEREPRWVQNMSIFVRGVLLERATAILDEVGALIGDSVLRVAPRNDPSAAIDPSLSTLFPIAFALSLLHCRNVELIDGPEPSRQMRRMAERRGTAAIRYKELVIDGLRQDTRPSAQHEGGSDVKRALHICRGHFATYSDDNPLFGRIAGTFWRPMHTRGSDAVGRIKKTYSIDSPKE